MHPKFRRYFLIGLISLGIVLTFTSDQVLGIMPMLLGLLFLGLAADIWLTHKRVRNKPGKNSPRNPSPDGPTDER